MTFRLLTKTRYAWNINLSLKTSGDFYLFYDFHTVECRRWGGGGGSGGRCGALPILGQYGYLPRESLRFSAWTALKDSTFCFYLHATASKTYIGSVLFRTLAQYKLAGCQYFDIDSV